jgi:hypothetical protein
MEERNPLVERVDALLRRHRQQQERASPAPAPPPPEDDIPVLTEVVDASPSGSPVEARRNDNALAREIERAVLEKVLTDLDRSIESRLNRATGEVVEQVLDSLRAELSLGLRQVVREAVATAVAERIADRDRRD